MAGVTPLTAPIVASSSVSSKASEDVATKGTKIVVDPVTRVEGHLKIEVIVKGGKVVDAKCVGGMFRGFEMILKDRDPRDASQIVQRICGVCPVSHATASVTCLEDAFGIKVNTSGRMVRNLALGANFLQSHILHFYHLAALDYVKGPDVAPFVPRYEKPDLLTDRIKDKATAEKVNKLGLDQYLKALEVRQICHEMVALFAGRMPHIHGFVMGGTTQTPTKEMIADYLVRFKKVRAFLEEEYLPLVYTLGSVYTDLFSVGTGCKNLLAFGVFPQDDDHKNLLFKSGVYVDGKDETFDSQKIKEEVDYSYLNQTKQALHYSEGETVPNVDKDNAYTFIKAPRYNGKPMEVGPLARMWVQNPPLSAIGQKLLKDLYKIDAKNFRDLGDKAFSVMGRHVARVEEAQMLTVAIEGWLKEIKPDVDPYVPSEVPAAPAKGTGFTEAPRGALLHFIDVKDKKISNYQVISATLWNASPMDGAKQHGPMEAALMGVDVPDVKNPVNLGRIMRSFDP